MKNKFLQWFAVCGRLGSKLMCIYFLLIVLPLGMFSFYAYLRVRNMVQEQTFSAARAAFRLVRKRLSASSPPEILPTQ